MAGLSTLKSSVPVAMFTVKDPTVEDDFGVKMSVLAHEGGYQLCRFVTKTGSNVVARQALFNSIVEAKQWAQRAYLCGEKFECDFSKDDGWSAPPAAMPKAAMREMIAAGMAAFKK